MPGGPLRLGGVDIPHTYQAEGHSDADVLLHAVIDAMLGAACLDDIGQMFPNSAEENRGRDSADMLRLAHEAVRRAGYEIVNLDCVLGVEHPKISPHKAAIRQRVADILDLDTQQFNLKAKSGEGLGPVGEGLIVEAHCVALLQQTAC